MTSRPARARCCTRRPISLQAPNWTADGKALIYNSDGRLYRFDLATEDAASAIDTGFATRNNNDHVLSFDGTMLGISHHSADDDGSSVIYTLPSTAGRRSGSPPKWPVVLPRLVARRQVAGLHRRSATAQFDIYKISADGGEETRLTTARASTTGPEYTPDGQYIYFNSTRTGRMQIWRMKPDGSEQEQVTNDEFNNWFPHISPDGKSIVVLSYGQDVEPERSSVLQARVPAARWRSTAATPTVIAYVYGGQGTINVPSWSPDSTRIAFVSNTALPAPH